jgi:TRAP-type mannitol/chloroaromatic compound transport system permease small subunit
MDLWRALAPLPLPVSLAVVGLGLLTFLALVMLPAAMLIRGEPGDWRDWLRDRRKAIGARAANGATDTELRLRLVLMALDGINVAVGRLFAWLALTMALTQFVIVVMRYVFAFGSIPMQESVWYQHGMLFMLGVGYTLALNGHIRVDVFYGSAGPRRRAMVDMLGAVLFLAPLSMAILWLSWPYVSASWAVSEGSPDGGGLPILYLLKTVIPVFALLLATQAGAIAIRAWLTLSGACTPDLDAGPGAGGV